MSETCQAVTITSRGTSPACGQPATYVYTNGDFRRFECDRHAEIVRQFIRYYSDDPREPRLTPLSDPATPDPA